MRPTRYDRLLNDEIEKERMIMSMRDMLITENVLKNGFSSVDVQRLERTLGQVAPVFKLSAPAAMDVYTDRYLPAASERTIHRWTPPVE